MGLFLGNYSARAHDFNDILFKCDPTEFNKKIKLNFNFTESSKKNVKWEEERDDENNPYGPTYFFLINGQEYYKNSLFPTSQPIEGTKITIELDKAETFEWSLKHTFGEIAPFVSYTITPESGTINVIENILNYEINIDIVYKSGNDESGDIWEEGGDDNVGNF